MKAARACTTWTVVLALWVATVTAQDTPPEPEAEFPLSFELKSISPESTEYSSLFPTTFPVNEIVQYSTFDVPRFHDRMLSLFANGSFTTWTIDMESATSVPLGVFPSPSKCTSSNAAPVGDGIVLVFNFAVPGCSPVPGIEVTDGATSDTYMSGPNNYLNALNISPPVTAGAAIAMPNEACTNITNPEEIAGNYCITYRGECTFQTKYENCLAAGAVGAIVINSLDSVYTLFVTSIENDFPFVSISSVDGEELVSLLNTTNGIVEITMGAEIEYGSYVTDPLSAYSFETLSAIPLDPPPFDYVDSVAIIDDSFFYSYNRSAGSVSVLDIADVANGTYSVLGSFSAADPSSLAALSKLELQDGSHLGILTYNNRSATINALTVYDISGDAVSSPREVAAIDLPAANPACPSAIINAYMTHGGYLYGLPDFFVSNCDADLVYEGVSYGKAPIAIFDPLNSTDPIGYFEVAELQEGNDVGFSFGKDEFKDIALVTMAGGGIVFYDFSDPLKPVAVSEVDRIIDPSMYTPSSSYTVGAQSAVFGGSNGDSAIWYSYIVPGGGTAELKEVTVTISELR